ncbi:LOW QUALITY PROTEIN: hypothetical protein YC2023_045763 [Brassica napus]
MEVSISCHGSRLRGFNASITDYTAGSNGLCRRQENEAGFFFHLIRSQKASSRGTSSDGKSNYLGLFLAEITWAGFLRTCGRHEAHEEVKFKINGLVETAPKVPEKNIHYGTPWPGNNVRDHPAMIKVRCSEAFSISNMFPQESVVGKKICYVQFPQQELLFAADENKKGIQIIHIELRLDQPFLIGIRMLYRKLTLNNNMWINYKSEEFFYFFVQREACGTKKGFVTLILNMFMRRIYERFIGFLTSFRRFWGFLLRVQHIVLKHEEDIEKY